MDPDKQATGVLQGQPDDLQPAQPGMQPSMQPGMQPGTQPGMQPGT